MGSFDKQIENASWPRFLVLFAALFAYSYWAFITPGFWTRANEAAAPLPETLQGFPNGQPGVAFANLGEATSDYLWFQAVDIPFAILNMLMVSAAIALALKIFHLGGLFWRFLLYVPVIMLASELIEDALLVLMAGGIFPVDGIFATVQQATTNVKSASGAIGMLIALIAIVASLVSLVFGALRRKRS